MTRSTCPRGYLHAAEALGGVSCHLTVGVHPVTRHAVLEALLSVVADEPALRASLPLGVDVGRPGVGRGRRAGDRGGAHGAARRVSGAEVSQRLARRLVGSSRPAPVAPLAQAEAYAALTVESVLSARPFQRHVLGSDGESLTLRLSDRTVLLPLAGEKAVRALLDGERLRVGDLPGLDGGDALALARTLVREAVVVVHSRP